MWLLLPILKLLLKLRYRIKVLGKIPFDRGILFLPNHAAEIDPVILYAVLGKWFKPRPVVVERFYYMKRLRSLFRKMRAIAVPDFTGNLNLWKQKQAKKAEEAIVEGLKQGDNLLLYPSGRLKIGAEEVVGGASMVHTLLEKLPQTPIVLIRTTGLWGSRFSRAITGVAPDFGKVVWEGIKIVLKNGIFFVPKREVEIVLEPASADFPRKSEKVALNHYLEKWYNTPTQEPLKLVSECFWKESFPKISTPKEAVHKSSVQIPPEVEKEIFEKIGQLARGQQISKEKNLERDLGLDSLDLAQLVLFLEARYGLEELRPGELQTVEEALLLAVSKPEQEVSAKSSKTWPEEPGRPKPLASEGKTVQECFLATCKRMGAHVACADEVMGVLTYVKMRRIVFVLARYLKKLEEKQIGILMPSLSTTYLLILATLFAGKTPVMLNWTLGQRALSHCRKAAGLKTVLTSRKFLDKLNNADLGDIEESLFFLEDLKLSLKEKLGAFFNPYAGGCEDETAVILFTSGTEALPKGVPLSHKNILSNHRAALEVVEFLSSDVFYGVLPPFHSFGFSVTGLFPVLTGIKVYFAPDPTRYHAMARDIDQWGVTLFCSAPTFILGVFKVAKPGELKSLRYIVAGAEKSPQKLFELVQNEGKELLEGYGITECAPVVTLTRPGRPHIGVGQPLPGIELCLIGEDSEIAICGPNVFAGYLNHEKDPFILREGKRWYLSGDLGKIAEDGSLILSGRSKRFVKIGGEMISLGGLEEELFKHYDKSLAVVAKEGDKPQIILFTTFDVTVGDVNQFLLEKGYGRLYAIAKVVKIDTIPVTGTGKIQYSSLNETL